MTTLPPRARFAARFTYRAALVVSAGLFATIAVTGCGLGTAASPSSEPTLVSGFSGKIFGGPTPVVGATVKIYTTGTVTVATGTVTAQAYRTGTMLQEASTAAGMSAGQDTNQYGAFSFAGGFLCPAGQFAYVVASGGNTGAGVVNPASLLVAALGRCEDLYTGTAYTGGTIYINEITTIAAAYALGNFAGTTGTGAATIVGIGADANNNAATGSTTQAAGLRHAFLNAASLVNVFANTGVGATNGANATLPTTTTDPLAVVPQAEINALGNSLISCVNSTGASSGACSTLFGATTLAGGATPANTFQSMINLAANPLLTGAGTNASTGVAYVPADIFNLASAVTSVYSPTLTASPVDWSITIHYPAGIGVSATLPAQGLLYPTSGTLDMNDNLYVGNQSAFTTSTKSNILGFSSNGTLLGTSADGTVSTSGLGISADALGNVYQLGSASNSNPLIKFSPSGGAPGSGTTISYAGTPTNSGAPADSAVDLANNVWYSTNNTQAANKSVWEYKAGATNPSLDYEAVSAEATNGIAVDPNQNIWTTSFSGTTASISILQNLGTVAAPTYTPVTGAPPTANYTYNYNLTSAGVGLYGIAFAAATATSTTPNYVAYTAANTPASMNGGQGLTPLTPTLSTTNTSAVASVTQGTQISSNISNPRYIASDGSGAIWAADTGGNRIRYYSPNVNAALQNTNLRPCVVTVVTGATPSTTCTIALSGPRYVLPDSTGSLWVVSIGTASNTGSVDQVIGAATPTYPLLSLGLSATKP